MTNMTTTVSVDEPKLDERFETLSAIYDDMNTTLKLQMVELRAGDVLQGKAMIKKLDELSSVLLALIKAEEAFHEKIKLHRPTSPADAETLRIEIGRKLDRIRRARPTGPVSEGAHGGAT